MEKKIVTCRMNSMIKQSDRYAQDKKKCKKKKSRMMAQKGNNVPKRKKKDLNDEYLSQQ